MNNTGSGYRQVGMDAISVLLMVLGGAIAALSGVWFLVVAFRRSVWWGLSNLFLPLANIAFLVAHPQLAWKPFVINIAGTLLIGAGLGVYISAHPELMKEPIAAEIYQR